MESTSTTAIVPSETSEKASEKEKEKEADSSSLGFQRAFTRFDSDSDSSGSDKQRPQKVEDKPLSVADFEELLTDEYETVLKELIVNPTKNAQNIQIMEKMWDSLLSYKNAVEDRNDRLKAKDLLINKQSEQLAGMTAVTEDKSQTASKKTEVIELKRQLDAAHIREQDHQETIEFLRKQVDRLESDIAKKEKDQDDYDFDGMGASARARENIKKEKVKVKQMLAEATDATEKAKMERDEYVNMFKTANTNLNTVRGQLNQKMADVTRLERLVNQTEKELKETKARLEQAARNFQVLLGKLEVASKAMEEQRSKNKELTLLLHEAQLVADDYREKETLHGEEIFVLRAKLSEAEDEIQNVTNASKLYNEELAKLKHEVLKTRHIQDGYSRKLVIGDSENSTLLTRFKNLETLHHERDKELIAKNRDIISIQRKMAAIAQEKIVLTKHILNATNLGKTNMKQIKTQTAALRSMELDNVAMREEIRVQKKAADLLKKHLNRLKSEKSFLTKRVNESMDEARQYKMQMYAQKKDLAKKELELKRERNSLESMKAEKNLMYAKLEEQKHLLSDLKTKMKVVTHQVEQLKEDAHNKEEKLAREDLHLKRLRAEKDGAAASLKLWKEKIKTACNVIEQQEIEKINVERQAMLTENAMSLQAKRMEQLAQDFCMLNTQLDRRTVELSLLYEKINLMDRILKQGEAQYNERLDDIRLLKLEVQKLRKEKMIVMKAFDNMSDLRHEIYHLNKDLAEERQKSQALQEEMETPINYHRWRLLEGTDPEKKDLIDKVRLLQKKLFKETENLALAKERYHNLEMTYDSLKQYIATLPGLNVIQTLEDTRRALRDKIEENKLFSAELSAYESEIQDYKYKVDKMKKDMDEIKAQYYALKQKRKSTSTESKDSKGSKGSKESWKNIKSSDKNVFDSAPKLVTVQTTNQGGENHVLVK